MCCSGCAGPTGSCQTACAVGEQSRQQSGRVLCCFYPRVPSAPALGRQDLATSSSTHSLCVEKFAGGHNSWLSCLVSLFRAASEMNHCRSPFRRQNSLHPLAKPSPSNAASLHPSPLPRIPTTIRNHGSRVALEDAHPPTLFHGNLEICTKSFDSLSTSSPLALDNIFSSSRAVTDARA